MNVDRGIETWIGMIHGWNRRGWQDQTERVALAGLTNPNQIRARP